MSFDELLFRAKAGDMDAKAEIFAMYRPLLIKYSLVNRRFDEDLAISLYYRPAPKDAGFHFVQAILPLPLLLPLKTRISLFEAIALPIATRCFSPPDKDIGNKW